MRLAAAAAALLLAGTRADGLEQGQPEGQQHASVRAVMPLSPLAWPVGNAVVNPFQNAAMPMEVAEVSHNQMVASFRNPRNPLPHAPAPVLFGPTGQSGLPLVPGPGRGYVFAEIAEDTS